jgi:hypothetical protein
LNLICTWRQAPLDTIEFAPLAMKWLDRCAPSRQPLHLVYT